MTYNVFSGTLNPVQSKINLLVYKQYIYNFHKQCKPHWFCALVKVRVVDCVPACYCYPLLIFVS